MDSIRMNEVNVKIGTILQIDTGFAVVESIEFGATPKYHVRLMRTGEHSLVHLRNIIGVVMPVVHDEVVQPLLATPAPEFIPVAPVDASDTTKANPKVRIIRGDKTRHVHLKGTVTPIEEKSPGIIQQENLDVRPND